MYHSAAAAPVTAELLEGLLDVEVTPADLCQEPPALDWVGFEDEISETGDWDLTYTSFKTAAWRRHLRTETSETERLLSRHETGVVGSTYTLTLERRHGWLNATWLKATASVPA